MKAKNVLHVYHSEKQTNTSMNIQAKTVPVNSILFLCLLPYPTFKLLDLIMQVIHIDKLTEKRMDILIERKHEEEFIIPGSRSQQKIEECVEELFWRITIRSYRITDYPKMVRTNHIPSKISEIQIKQRANFM